MFEVVKIAGLGAIVAAGLVAGSEGIDTRAAATGPKKYTDRVAAPITLVADAMPQPALRLGSCASQTWPYIASECLDPASDASPRKNVRTITVERREGANTSVLVRLPVGAVASR